MNTAQHADRILAAWRIADRPRLEAALENAHASCKNVRSISLFEAEREEMLRSVVEHLQTLDHGGVLPDVRQRSGALTLLSHLRSQDFARKN